MAAPQDDVAFRSQEYASQVNRDLEPARQRQQNATEGFVNTVGQGASLYLQRGQEQRRQMLAERELMQRQQQIDMQKEVDASNIALGQARRKQSEYELWFTQQIHNTKAVEAQRRIISAQADTAEYARDKAKRESEEYRPRDITVPQMMYMFSQGTKYDPRSANKMIEATPEETAMGKKFIESQASRADIASRAEDRKMRQGDEALEVRKLQAQSDLLHDELGLTERLPKAEKEQKRDALMKELMGVRRRLRELGASARTPDQQDEEPEATPAPSSGATNGGNFYLDMARKMGGK